MRMEEERPMRFRVTQKARKGTKKVLQGRIFKKRK
jgi:hypothetical protein